MSNAVSSDLPVAHSSAFRRRRFLNWFPLGLSYAMLYMGRYNLTVAKNSIDLITKEDFGVIFSVGALIYAVAFLINGPLTDKMGGKRAILTSLLGAFVANVLMGVLVQLELTSPGALGVPFFPAMVILYALNMYFQSFGAVAIVKVNAHWFHVRERGSFSGVFGTMIASGIFFAFTVNGWLLSLLKAWGGGAGQVSTWWVFYLPSVLLITLFAIELFVLRDRPGQAGFEDFDTGDADGSGGGEVSVFQVMKRILTNPIILTFALIEFCTGVLRNGVMHWFPFYIKEVWALPGDHPLQNGSWTHWELVIGLFALAIALGVMASFSQGRRRTWLVLGASTFGLLPFFQAGWGGLLMIAGVIGANVAGRVSDLFFQSRRAPAAGGLYLGLAVCAIGMVFSLGETTPRVGWVRGKGDFPIRVGDEVLSVAGKKDLKSWTDVSEAIACVPSRCEGSGVRWDPKLCLCSSRAPQSDTPLVVSTGSIPIRVQREGAPIELSWKDPLASARAGDRRVLPAGPVLTLSPYWLGVFVFLVSLCVIGTHGLLSGTATMDFGGRRAAATAVGVIDGFVYLGTSFQGLCLGYLTTRNWVYWPLFLLPFALIGFGLLTRIWHAKPRSDRPAH